ncbi:MAG: hypothetical protein BMS9Abin12_0291 [Acidimicrobiia bacterium]|nr:MAG: hypothetical protein BMS9Abin12_0291 [Acidimicrobiia bacterium]
MEPFSREIQEHQFSTALRGYDRAEIDVFLTDCGSHMAGLEERLRIAEVRAADCEEELAGLNGTIEALLQDATDARRVIIEEAKAEAKAIADQSSSMGQSNELTDAAATAAAIVSEAEAAVLLLASRSEHDRASAEEEALRIVRRAEESAAQTQAEADRILDKARMDANSIREETTSIRASMKAQLAEIRGMLDVAQAGGADLDDRASTGDPSWADPDLVIDLRDESTTPEPHHAAG